MQKCKVSEINAFLLFMQRHDYADTLGGGGGQKFRQNPSVSHGFRDKCIFLHFMQKFMMATKNDRKMLFGKNAFLNHLIVQIPSGVKNFAEITLSHTVSEINVFLHSTQKFKMANKDGGKMTYGKNCHVTLQIPRGGGGGQKFL